MEHPTEFKANLSKPSCLVLYGLINYVLETQSSQGWCEQIDTSIIGGDIKHYRMGTTLMRECEVSIGVTHSDNFMMTIMMFTKIL